MTERPLETATLLVSCPDRRGVVAALAQLRAHLENRIPVCGNRTAVFR